MAEHDAAYDNLRRCAGLRELTVSDDGNCQFRAVSYGIWGTQRYHAALRSAAAAATHTDALGAIKAAFDELLAQEKADATDEGVHHTLPVKHNLFYGEKY